jgi:hypothetical protein
VTYTLTKVTELCPNDIITLIDGGDPPPHQFHLGEIEQTNYLFTIPAVMFISSKAHSFSTIHFTPSPLSWFFKMIPIAVAFNS